MMKFCLSGSLLLLLIATSCTPRPYTEDGTVSTRYVHQYGVDIADNNEWVERGSSGQIIKKLKDGSTHTQTYRDGKLHGVSMLTFAHSHIIMQETYFDKGTCVWKTTNYPSGMPKRQDVFQPESIIAVTTWYEDGTPRSDEEYHGTLLVTGKYFTRDQDLETEVITGNGERINRDGHGQLVAQDEIVNGKRILEVVYYANGMPQKYIPYVDDKIEGTLKTFHPGGEPNTIEEWHQGLQHGHTQVFTSGKRIAVVPYVNGKKEGVETRYRPGTETVAEEISWKDDLKDGPSTVYVEDGSKVTEYFFEGKKVSRMEYVEHQSNVRSTF